MKGKHSHDKSLFRLVTKRTLLWRGHWFRWLCHVQHLTLANIPPLDAAHRNPAQSRSSTREMLPANCEDYGVRSRLMFKSMFSYALGS